MIDNHNYFSAINKRYFSILVYIVFVLTLFVFPQPAHAQTQFWDEFNGNGELHAYNNAYELLTDFHNDTGTFSVNTDHVVTTGYDPGYVYTAIPGDNICASIDFNWTGGYPTGHWTNIILHSTPNAFGVAFQVRNDDATHQRWVLYDNSGAIYISGSVSFDETQTHTLKACVVGKTLTGYLDGIQLFIGQDTLYSGGYVGFASQERTYYMDNFIIETAPVATLPVPILKQISDPWQSQIYDSANLWSPLNTTINRWGCALTSAAMVLQYHGINKLPDNTELDPGTLNAWLKGQPDGYVGNGYLNWLAVSRLSMLAKQSGNNPGFLFDALEYNRIENEDKTQLTTDLQNNIPGILEEPGHFVVAKGVNGDTFDINDPYYTRTTLNDGYGNTFLKLGRFVPSSTDLSYIQVVVPEDIDVSLINPDGNTDGSIYIQQPIIDPLTGILTNGPPIKIIYLQKPPTGEYQLIFSSETGKIYDGKAYLYDDQGNVKIILVNGVLGNNDSDIATLNFDPGDTNSISLLRVVTFASTLSDLHSLRHLGSIKSPFDKAIARLLTDAQKDAQKGKKASALTRLNFLRILLGTLRNRGISEAAYQILIADVNELINSLKNP